MQYFISLFLTEIQIGLINMPKQEDLDSAYLDMAEIWARLSKAKRKQVGCLIVKNGAIISDGYNGTPRGFDNNCEIEDPKSFEPKLITKEEVLHEESNAITKLAKSTQSSDGATMYITISPCIDCAKLIIQSGIKRVVFAKLYSKQEGLELLRRANVEIVHLPDDEARINNRDK